VWGVGIHQDVVQASLIALLSAASSVRLDHILVDTNTPHLLIAAGCCALNVCSSLGVTTATNLKRRFTGIIEIDNVQHAITGVGPGAISSLATALFLVDTNTPHLLIAAGCCALNVCSSLGVTTATNGVISTSAITRNTPLVAVVTPRLLHTFSAQQPAAINRLAALSSAIREAWTTSWWIPTPHTC
jgi:hypothetical protein